jgi:hypothetical protein
LLIAAAAGTSSLALLGFAADPAFASYTAQVQNGVLQITGDGASDKLALVPDGTALAVDVGEDGTIDFRFDAGTFSSINIQAGGGDDTVDASNGIVGFGPLTIDGGSGNDTIRGGDGADTLFGGNGNDTIDGNRGNDVAFGGAGSDTFVWDPGDGNDTLEGQSGTDALNFNGSNAGETIDVSANGSRVLLTRDIAAISMDLNGIEGLNIRALGSADTITINDLTGTGLTKASVDLSGLDGQPDQSADTVIDNGTAAADKVAVTTSGSQVLVSGLKPALTVTGSEQADTLRVNTLGGKDQATVAPEVSQLITPVVDLGVDQ